MDKFLIKSAARQENVLNATKPLGTKGTKRRNKEDYIEYGFIASGSRMENP